jgi:hypothetical protein
MLHRSINAALVAAILTLITLLAAQNAAAAYDPAPERIVRAAMRAKAPPAGTVQRRAWIICHSAFRGRLCRPALNVAWCESDLDPRARNGQYRGAFQMGRSERRRFGHGRTILSQARAARRYHRLSGWSPWECRPW